MKKQLLLSISFGLFISAQAQITLNQNNVPHSSSYNNARNEVIANISLPAHGENQEYAYEFLISTFHDTIRFREAIREGFEDFTRFSFGYSTISDIQVYSEYYTHKTASGVQVTGSYKLPEVFPIGQLTGGPQDTLTFPGNASIFEEPGYNIKFPTTYGDSWTSEYYYTTNFNLTVAAFGLNNTPGYQKQKIVKTDSVVGAGTLTIPTSVGVSIPYEVLLIKESRVATDSVFLGGQPAPQTLLDAFGIVQGGSSALNRYKFYAENFERPILEIFMSEDWATTEFAYYISNDIETVGIRNLSNISNVNVFPNPIEAGTSLFFTQTQNFSNPVLQVYDMLGREVFNQRINNNSSVIEWNVPANLENGVYIYNLVEDQKPSNKISGRFIVK